jgi:hypothetical protein
LTVELLIGLPLAVTAPFIAVDEDGGVPLAIPARASVTFASPFPASLVMTKVALYFPAVVGWKAISAATL